jgi:hypothetical protein
MTKLYQTFFLLTISILINAFGAKTHALPPANNEGYFLLKVYHYSNRQQEAIIDNFLQNNFVPSLHTNGFTNIGVFKALANDTSADKRMYVFIPFKSLKQWEKFMQSGSNKLAQTSAGEYIDAVFDKPPYTRIETIFMSAFKYSPQPAAPNLKSAKSERVYELRSYESSTEKLNVSKVKMFNEGGEINIFSRLGFNAIFYGQVIFGARMPNLMYMTSFENMKARDEHWKSFGSDPAWKDLSAMKEYEHTVAVHDINFLRPTQYSDL